MPRKKLLYRSKVEYADWCINHVEGCSHSCRYPCYAFLMKQRFGVVRNWAEWGKPRLIPNALELLDKELPKVKDHVKEVFMCFTTDPFMYCQGEVTEATLKIIGRLNVEDIPVRTLTKGVTPASAPLFTIGGKPNWYGISLVSIDESFRKKFEPGAAPYTERIAALRELKNKGAKVWVSMEPYPTPDKCEQDLGKVLEEIAFVDRIVFGRWNYAGVDGDEFYSEKAKEFLDFCQRNKIDGYVKNDITVCNKKGGENLD